jgi:sialate O-acetylesterase
MLDMRLLSLPLLLLFGAPCHGDAPRFGNQFQSHMVLQRDAPLSLWGFDAGVNETLRVCLGARCVHTQCAGDGTWRVGTIEPQRASVTPRDLWVIRERDGQGTLLEDIVFGDVFIFSGQSNIDIPEAYGHQVAPLRADPSQSGEAAQLAEEQLAETLGASGMLRMRIVDVFDDASPRWNATEGQPELTATPDCARCPPPFAIGNYSWCQCSQMAWTRPDAVTVRGFSATSWFTAVALRKIVPALHDDVPIGIVKSSKGGSTIDLWSSEDARRQCKPPGPPPPPCAAPALCPGSLWSQMMAPLAGLKFKAVTWYQVRLRLCLLAPPAHHPGAANPSV